MEDATTLDVIRPLEGWMTLPDAAEILGMTRSNMHKMVRQGHFAPSDLRRVAERTILIRPQAVQREHERRSAARVVVTEEHAEPLAASL